MSTTDIIIVNWNTALLLRMCLASLLNYTDMLGCRITVVDNGSMDGSAELIKREFPLVATIRNAVNVGFAKANNQVINQSSAEYVCLVNSDIEFRSDAIGMMTRYLDEKPDSIACAPALALPDGRLQAGAGGYLFTVTHAWNYYLFLSTLMPFWFKGIMIDQNHLVRRKRPVRLDWLSGACLMVRRCAIAQSGLLDESYFMYAEDVELFDRLRLSGSVWYLPQIQVVHNHGGSSRNDGLPATAWMDSMFRYMRSRTSPWGFFLFRLSAIIGYALRAIIYGLTVLLGGTSFRKSRAMLHYMRHAFVAGNGMNMPRTMGDPDPGPS